MSAPADAIVEDGFKPETIAGATLSSSSSQAPRRPPGVDVDLSMIGVSLGVAITALGGVVLWSRPNYQAEGCKGQSPGPSFGATSGLSIGELDLASLDGTVLAWGSVTFLGGLPLIAASLRSLMSGRLGSTRGSRRAVKVTSTSLTLPIAVTFLALCLSALLGVATNASGVAMCSEYQCGEAPNGLDESVLMSMSCMATAKHSWLHQCADPSTCCGCRSGGGTDLQPAGMCRDSVEWACDLIGLARPATGVYVGLLAMLSWLALSVAYRRTHPLEKPVEEASIVTYPSLVATDVGPSTCADQKLDNIVLEMDPVSSGNLDSALPCGDLKAPAGGISPVSSDVVHSPTFAGVEVDHESQ